MNRFTSLCVVVGGGLWVGACGGSASPTAPTAAALAVTPTTTILVVGQTQTYAVVNGPSPNLVTWTSTDNSVLTIDNSGSAAAVGSGVVTITATAIIPTVAIAPTASETIQTATLQVQVVPIYQGTWTGNTTNVTCTSISGFAAYCSQALGTVQPLTLSLTQTNATVSGVLTKSEPGGVLSGTVSGSIGPSGNIILTGTLNGVTSGGNLVATLISWDALATGTTMTGIWAANITSPQIAGLATVQWSLTGVNRDHGQRGCQS